MATLLEYKCPCCGGVITFDTTTQKMLCPYCNTSFEVEDLKKNDEVLNSERKENLEWSKDEEVQWDENEDPNIKNYECESCGGQIMAEQTTGASECPYCGSTVVMKGNFSGVLKPNIVIPFKLDKNAAMSALTKHFKGKVLLPKIFKSEHHIQEVKGVYVPFWLFGCDVDADIMYKGTKVRRWSTSSKEYTETSFYNVFRSGNVAFDDIPVDGSTKMDDALMESIEPYNYSDAVDFQTAYLSGFMADKYDVTSKDSEPRANHRIKNSTEELFKDTAKEYTTLVTQNSSVILKDNKVRYALLPVWMLRTKWNGKDYIFAMNGQTGKMVGDLPMNKAKLALFAVGATTVVTAISALIISLL